MISLPSMRSMLAAAAAVVLTMSALPARASSAIERPINVLVKAVRYGRDSLALKQLDGDAQGRALFGDEWTKATAAQRKEFISLFDQLFAGIAFPKIKSNLHYLSTTVYDTPKISGGNAHVVSTIVIDNPVKKQEMRVEYALHKAGGWKVVDVTVLGSGSKSMLTSIREDQIKPIFASGGWNKLLGLMRNRLAQIKK